MKCPATSTRASGCDDSGWIVGHTELIANALLSRQASGRIAKMVRNTNSLDKHQRCAV